MPLRLGPTIVTPLAISWHEAQAAAPLNTPLPLAALPLCALPAATAATDCVGVAVLVGASVGFAPTAVGGISVGVAGGFVQVGSGVVLGTTATTIRVGSAAGRFSPGLGVGVPKSSQIKTKSSDFSIF